MYIELQMLRRLTRLTGKAWRGKTAITSPGRLVQRLAVLTTTELLVSVRK
ncbi:hypothetical protein [Kitasatospora acidiphila]|nr:hypothetical protein [Kitasatospora acidiphila]